jgi:hypothetical protein
MRLSVLDSGSCERLKAGVHSGGLALVALMCAYNTAAWVQRRERHLGVNALLYAAATIWEQRHIAHHLRALRECYRTKGEPAASAEETPAA